MTVADANTPPSQRTRVRREAHRGNYDKAMLHAIVDDAWVCHVAFADEQGVHCIPTACWREGDYLYIHGSNGSRMLKVAQAGAQVCVTITHLDGLVLARSAFNHSMNYRSAMIYGVFEAVSDEHKSAALDTFLEHIAPGRGQEARRGNPRELAATTVLRISLAEAASKVRTGGGERRQRGSRSTGLGRSAADGVDAFAAGAVWRCVRRRDARLRDAVGPARAGALRRRGRLTRTPISVEVAAQIRTSRISGLVGA